MEAEKIDNDTAYKLLTGGATFIFLNVPAGTEFGIDLKCWTVGNKFKGVKMIPPGVHFIYYSAKNKYGDTGPRSGFIQLFRQKEFVVKKWDSVAEGLSTEGVYPSSVTKQILKLKQVVAEEEIEIFRNNLLNMDEFLGPYPYEIWEKWKSLTNHITENLVEKLTPESKCIRSVLELVPVKKDENSKSKRRWSKSRTEEERQEDLLPELEPAIGTQIRFTDMPNKRYPDGSSPSEITSHYLDSTYALNKMLFNYKLPLEFVGETQFAFVCFLIGQNLEAFEHWKRLVQLLCSCDDAIRRYPQLYHAFIQCLDVQLDEIPHDFLADIVANANVIYRSVRELFANVECSKETTEGGLVCRIYRLKDKLSVKFGWDFSNLQDDDDEDTPVVVDVTSGE